MGWSARLTGLGLRIAALPLTIFGISVDATAMPVFMGLGGIDLSGSYLSTANAVSADGSIVVGMAVENDVGVAFQWDAANGMRSIPEAPGIITPIQAYGVSADGSTIVGTGSSTSGSEAFRWTAGGVMVGLGDLLGGSFASSANGVSPDGTTIVGRGTGPSGSEAF